MSEAKAVPAACSVAPNDDAIGGESLSTVAVVVRVGSTSTRTEALTTFPTRTYCPMYALDALTFVVSVSVGSHVPLDATNVVRLNGTQPVEVDPEFLPQKRVALLPVSIPRNPSGAVTRDAFGPPEVEKMLIGSSLRVPATSRIH